MDKNEKIAQLYTSIRSYNESYRAGKPEISDSDYDKLVEELRNLDPNNEWFSHIEPAAVEASRKRKLPIPMKSLDKVKNIRQLMTWATSLGLPQQQEMVIMPKYDGLSLLYNEETKEAYSRGGIENEGQDCTKHAHAACIEPIGYPQLHYTYGELVFSTNNWDTYFKGKNSELTGNPYKSPRNTVAGFLNRDTPTNMLSHTTFARYGTDMESLKHYQRFSALLAELEYPKNGIYHFMVLPLKNINEELLAQMFEEWRKEFYIDGIVIYINNVALWETIGRHQTSGNPMYAIAYKHPDFTDAFETTVLGVNWKVSKSGALKPVVKIDMVDTGDCNMENPTGYNAGWLSDHCIAPGAKILVTRSGGVIPKILSTIELPTAEESRAMWDDIATCPHCGAPTAWDDSMIEIKCTNSHCRGRKLAKIVFFYNICGAENMGEETLSKIFDAGFDSIPLMLQVRGTDLMRLEGFGDAVIDNVLNNNQRILKGMEMSTLMHASDCFKGIGAVKARSIIDNMTAEERKNLYNFTWETPSKYEYSLMSKTMQAFNRGILYFFAFLDKTGIPVLPYKREEEIDGPCSGINVCMTGFRDKELEDKIVSMGGKIASGVSKKTTHLIVADKNSSSSKMEKAMKLGTKIMTISEFLQSID